MKKFSDEAMAVAGMQKTVAELLRPEPRRAIETTVLMLMAVAHTTGDARFVGVVNDGVVRARYYAEDGDHSHYLQWEGQEKDWDQVVSDLETGILAEDEVDEDGDAVSERTPLESEVRAGGQPVVG